MAKRAAGRGAKGNVRNAPHEPPAFKVEWWPTVDVTPYHRNPRRNADAVEGVAGSIEAFGWRQPIVVDEKGVVIVGHTRLQAAHHLGLKRVPVHVAEGLSPDEAKAYRIRDNAEADKSSFEDSLLALELLDLRESGLDPLLSGLPASRIDRLLPGPADESGDDESDSQGSGSGNGSGKGSKGGGNGKGGTYGNQLSFQVVLQAKQHELVMQAVKHAREDGSAVAEALVKIATVYLENA